jgi:hypothetical protein
MFMCDFYFVSYLTNILQNFKYVRIIDLGLNESFGS